MNRLNRSTAKSKRTNNGKKYSTITIRIDKKTKEGFEKVCADMGLTMRDAIMAFITKVIEIGTIPFLISVHGSRRDLGTQNKKYNIDYEGFDKLNKEIAEFFGAR